MNQVKVLLQFITTFSVLIWEHIGKLNSHLKASTLQVLPQVSGFKLSQTLLALTPSKWKDFWPLLPPSCCCWTWSGPHRILSGTSTEAEPALSIAVWNRIFLFVYLISAKPLKGIKHMDAIYRNYFSPNKVQLPVGSTKQLFKDHTNFWMRKTKRDFRIFVQVSSSIRV